MNTYEALFIFKPFLDLETNAENPLKAVENMIHSLKGRVVHIDKMGRRRLSYDIQKFKDGALVTVLMELAPNVLADLRKYCQLNEDILRVTFVRLSEDELAFMRAPRPQRPMRSDRGPDRGERGERHEQRASHF